LLRSGPAFSFSSIAQKTFVKFSERYAANIQEFQKRVASSATEGETLKRSTLRAYVHPYNDPHKRVISGVAETLKAESDLRGAEPVSPHYEHFSFARRQALIFLGGLGVLRFIASTEDFFMFAQSATWAWTFYFAYTYFWLEGKKYFLLPFLTRFYRKLLNLELSNVETYWAENTEVRIRNLMSTAKEQIEYKSVHGDYLSIRNNTLLNFLISEQLALKNHIHSRAENILREAETLEAINQNKIISSVLPRP